MYTKVINEIERRDERGEKMDSKELFGEVQEQEETIIQEVQVRDDLLSEETVENAKESEPVPEVFEEKVEFRPEHIQQQVEEVSKKGNNGIAVAVVTLLFILVIGLCVYIAVSVSNMIPQKGQEDKEYESQTGNPWEELLGDDYKENETQQETPEEDPDSVTETPDGGLHEYPNYDKNDFDGPYYQDVVDCIDETVSYKINREFYDCVEQKDNVSITTSYIRLEGDIPGLDEINRVLEENATYFVKSYEENKKEILDTLNETETGIDASIKSYVTYNTESMISVVVYEKISMGYMYQDVALYCYNINLDTGTILDNHTILDLGEGFGQEFRDRSNKQNGVSEGGIEPYSNEEIEAMLTDDTSLILFYTPLGVELGYNYKGGYYTGWITITMQDYEKYISSL